MGSAPWIGAGAAKLIVLGAASAERAACEPQLMAHGAALVCDLQAALEHGHRFGVLTREHKRGAEVVQRVGVRQARFAARYQAPSSV